MQDQFSEQKITQELIKALKGNKLIIPRKETEFLNPTLREMEWIFVHNFMRIH